MVSFGTPLEGSSTFFRYPNSDTFIQPIEVGCLKDKNEHMVHSAGNLDLANKVNKRTVRSARWPLSCTSYSPVTNTSLWISSRKHFFWFWPRWNMIASIPAKLRIHKEAIICRKSIMGKKDRYFQTKTQVYTWYIC